MSTGPRYNRDTGEWELPDRQPSRDADRTGSQALPPSVGVLEPEEGSQSRLWGIAAGVLAFLADRGYPDAQAVHSAEESLIFALPPELRRDLRAAAKS
jgi:hypothetical protein